MRTSTLNAAGRLARITALSLLSMVPATAWAGGCEGPILLVYPADRAPLSSSLQGQPQGLVAAYLALLQAQYPTLRATPLAATFLPDAALPAGTVATLGWPRARAPEGWVTSTPYLHVPQMIVRRHDAAPVIGLEGLQGGSVASPDIVALARVLEDEGLDIPLLQVPAVDKALQLLAAGQVEAVVANLVEIEAALRSHPGGALDVAAPAGFSDALVLATAPACADLAVRFNQLQVQMTQAQRDALQANWTFTAARRSQAPVSPLRWSIALLLVLLSMGLVYAFGYWRLHREGARREALEQRLQDVTANLPAVVYQARRSSTGQYSVPHIAGDVHALFGISVDTARADHGRLLAAVHPQDRALVLACVDAAALVRGPIDITFRTRGPHGWRWVRSHGRPIACNDSGVEWSGYWMDVTEAHARAQALNDARREAEQADAAKTHFLATMSHEIRTPMSTLIGMLECFGSSTLDGRQRQVLATIDDAAEMLRQILDDVLHSQRLQPGPQPPQCVPTDMAELLRAVQRLLAPVAASKGLHLRCEVDPALQRGSLADGLRLRQILFNLAGNALKFTLQGSVDLQLRVLQQHPHGQQLRLQVTDTGVGISRERQRAVFAAFTQAEASTTRRFGGSGLGLAICRELAASMGAQLQLRSAVGEGTVIWLDLFAASCALPSLPAAEAVTVLQVLPPVRVLVAEDHPTNLQLLVGRLQELGLQVHATADGRQAWQAWQAQRFALVITDCHMPDMDGFALARAIRADTRAGAAQVPIIALTASVLESTREACRAAGIDHFLAKPVERDALHATLVAVLAGQAAPSVSQ
ncbi:MAG: response regulator [Stenotrophomonas sp.]